MNFAVYAKKCGEESAYLGLIADDAEGWLIYNSLNKLGVDVSHSKPAAGLTTERCDVKLEDGDRFFIGSEYGEGEWMPLKLSDEQCVYLEGFDVIHCGCYAEMADEIQMLDRFKAVKTYDFSSEEEYRTAEYLEKVCPHIDIALFSQEEMSAAEAGELADKVLSLGCRLVLITNGTGGQKLWDGKAIYNGQVKKAEAVDTMGAGDSFFTAFIISLMRNGFGKGKVMSKEIYDECFAFASIFSAETCMEHGAFGFGTEY